MRPRLRHAFAIRQVISSASTRSQPDRRTPERRAIGPAAISRVAAAFRGSNHMAILSEKQVEQQLSKLHDWALEGRAIRKQFTFNDFPAAVAFVNRLVPDAQAA